MTKKHFDEDQTQLFNNIQNSNNSGPISGGQSPKTSPATQAAPLAHLARPQTLEEFEGIENILKSFPFLKAPSLPSLVLWGPPGSGKTTLAHLLSKQGGYDLSLFNAVLGGVNDLRKIITRGLEMKKLYGHAPLIFIDEIHRFNKAQQDALLPYLETKEFTLIGATTQNPNICLNKALLSRISLVELPPLKPTGILSILKRASEKFALTVPEDILGFISTFSGGDARKGLSLLELVKENFPQSQFQSQSQSQSQSSLTPEIEEFIKRNSREYDRDEDRHYDVISAFIKSLRGSDPDAALLWLAVMIDGGEDPVFIARRLIIFASEDVGNADPMGLVLATATLTAVQNIGMPEARINLAHATTYLAGTLKSHESYQGIERALAYVRERPTMEVPPYLKGRPPQGMKQTYLYPHDYPEHFVRQKYSLETLPQFYLPSSQGREKFLQENLKRLWEGKFT